MRVTREEFRRLVGSHFDRIARDTAKARAHVESLYDSLGLAGFTGVKITTTTIVKGTRRKPT